MPKFSKNTPVNEDYKLIYLDEDFYYFNKASLLPYRLLLKVGIPIIVLRNLNPPEVYNGTRAILIAIGKNILIAKILIGRFRGNKIILPRIPL